MNAFRLTKEQVDRINEIAAASDGNLTAKAVVADAKNESSPLHTLFDWDVDSAAEKWWEHRAREIIGSVTVQVTTTEHNIRTPVYVTDGRGDGYRSVTALRRDPAAARESLVYTLEVAAGHLRRAYDLAGPLGMENEIDELLQRIVGVQRAIQQAA